jgi:hypothetical protein
VKTEVTLRIFDPDGRGAQWWAELLQDIIQDEGGETIEIDDEEVG